MKHKLTLVLFLVTGFMLGHFVFKPDQNKGKIIAVIDLDNYRLESVVNKTGSPVRFESQMSKVDGGDISSWTFTLTKNP